MSRADVYEWLMTYLWALLSALIVIGILVYYILNQGLDLNPINFICVGRNYCNFLGLELKSVDLDMNDVIICQSRPTNYSVTSIKFYITDKEQLFREFKECKND